MYKSILVPLDGSRFAEHALPPAIALARHAGAALRLVTVSTPLAEISAEGVSFSAGELENELSARYRAYLDAAGERVKARGVAVGTEVLVGEVAEALCADAARRADLIVMATHGRGTLERYWLGSVADEVIRHVTRPVLLIRPDDTEPDLAAEPRLNPELVSLDGSPLAERVLDHAVELAGLSPGADLVLLRAITGVSTAGEPPDTPEAQREARGLLTRVQEMQAHLRREAEQYLEKVAAGLAARGVKARSVVIVEDQPAAAILNEAKALGAGLIALETRGRAGLSRFFLGSVADKVIRAANIPVLVHRQQE